MAYDPENNPYIPGDSASYDLSWVVERLNEHKFAEESAAEAKIQADRAENEADRAAGFADDASGYADAASDSAGDAADSAQDAADYAAHIADPVSGIVTQWLDDNITQPTTPVVDASLSVAGAAADAKVTGDAIFRKQLINLITKSNFRNSASAGVNSITSDKDLLTLLWDLTLSVNTDTSTVTLNTVPITVDNSKDYYFYAHIKALSGNTINQGAISVQWMRDGYAPEQIATDVLPFSINMDGIIFAKFRPSRTTGYLRFAFNGMGTGTKRLYLEVDKLVFIEEDANVSAAEINSAILNNANPVLYVRIPKIYRPIDADILFWGDSLTAGAGGGGTTYPAVCASILGKTYKNCGVGGENCQTIAARQGGNNVVIPAGAINGTYSELKDIFGNNIAPLLQGDGSLSASNLLIDGEKCSLSYSGGVYTISGYTGPTTTVPIIAAFYGSSFKSTVAVIWIGTNGGSYPGSSGNAETIKYWAQSMISHLEHKNFIVMGLSIGEQTASYYIELENTLKQAFGNKYFPTREYLINYGLTLEGITPTSQDTADIAAGKVPTSLRSDATHLNAAGYDAVGKLLANKIISLGYFD